MRLAVCELPEGVTPGDAAWRRLFEQVTLAAPDLLVLNEMPVGDWIAERRPFDEAGAQSWATAHEGLVEALLAMPWAVCSSRPIRGPRLLANEAFLTAGGQYLPVHHKHCFPQEEGWYEADWFEPAKGGFDVVTHGPLCLGVLLCTELMFNEWARHYRHQGAHVIAVPRATGALDTKWKAAGAMAAVVSGCYVASSNRSAPDDRRDSQFGGGGFIYAPDGELIAQTTRANPVAVVDVDFELVRRAQRGYPCYVPELPA